MYLSPEISNHSQKELRQVEVMVANTMKPEKVLWMWTLLQTMARGHVAKDLVGEGALLRCWAHELAKEFQEPAFNQARFSADFKAAYLNDQTPPEVWVSGADSIVHVFDASRYKWQTLHKAGRDSGQGMTAELVAKEYRRMRDLLVYPKSRYVYAAWDLSATYANGSSHNFSEYLLVKSKPVERGIFWNYFGDSVKTGKLLKLAPRVELLEMLLENDSGLKLGFVNQHRREDLAGENVWDDLQAVDEIAAQIAQAAVISTVPLGVFSGGGDKMVDVFIAAREMFGNIQE